MPTYDYLCQRCGYEGEYRNVPVNATPNCEGCGSNEGMKRQLNRQFSVGSGMKAREVHYEDTRKQPGLEIKIEQGYVRGNPALRISAKKVTIDNSPSSN